MKEIRLKQLDLRDFKGGTFNLPADGNDVDVYADNGVGKTRLADAWSWLLFGKDSLGNAQFPIKNLNSQGEAEHGLEHSVEGILQEFIDGVPRSETTLRRVFHEVWSKKRGSTQKELTGNTTEYYIDGVPKKEREYIDYITEITHEETVFQLLTSPTAFANLHWQKARGILMEVCGDLTAAQVIETNSALAPLTDLLKKFTVSKSPLDDLKKVVTSRRTEINKEIDKLPVRIDEVRRGLPDVTGLDRKELYENIVQLEASVNNAQLRLQGVDNGAGIAELSKELQGLKYDISQLENAYYLEGTKHVTRLNARINEITSNRDAEQRAVQGIKDEIITKQTRIASLETQLEKLRTEWTEIDAETFQEVAI